MGDTKLVTNISEPLTESGGNGKKFQFRYRRLGPLLGLKKIACSVYSVPPGKGAFPYHAHSVIEEMVVILEGSGMLRHEGEERPVKAGDVIASPLGEAHQITNTSEDELRYLAISSNDSTDVVKYPDSGKILAYSLDFPEPLFHMTKAEDATAYYDGEDE